MTFPAIGPLGKAVECKAGLSADIKCGLGLTDYSPGLLSNYLLTREIPLDESLNPSQFEDLASVIFKEEGWDVNKTPTTRDGGKDIILHRKIHDHTTIAYVQAKRYSKTNKVGIEKVKEFVATVAGDRVDRGYLVTSSYFTKPATNWLTEKGIDLASIELIDHSNLQSRIQQIANGHIPAYFLKSLNKS